MLAGLQVDSVAGVCGAGTEVKSDIDDKSVDTAVCIIFSGFFMHLACSSMQSTS